MADGELASWSARVTAFEADAHSLLSKYEDAHHSRAVTLGDLLNHLQGLNSRQDELFRQALRCAELGIYLAAHVIAWAAVMDLFEEKLASDGLVKVGAAYSKWPTTSLEDLREEIGEYQLIEAGKKIGLLAKGQYKSMHGNLHTRNQAAHPTGFSPSANETLGYIEALLKLAKVIEKRTL